MMLHALTLFDVSTFAHSLDVNLSGLRVKLRPRAVLSSVRQVLESLRPLAGGKGGIGHIQSGLATRVKSDTLSFIILMLICCHRTASHRAYPTRDLPTHIKDPII